MKTDLTKYRQDILNSARQHLSDKHLKGYVYSDAENNLVLKDSETGRKHYIKTYKDFKALSLQLVTDVNFHKKQEKRRNTNR